MIESSKLFMLPYKTKYFGVLILIVSIAFSISKFISGIKFTDFFSCDASMDIFAIHAMTILGNCSIVFAKEKVEDEYINSIRLKSFATSLLIHSVYFFIFSFTNLTLSFVNFSAMVLMNSMMILYLLSFYISKLK